MQVYERNLFLTGTIWYLPISAKIQHLQLQIKYQSFFWVTLFKSSLLICYSTERQSRFVGY